MSYLDDIRRQIGDHPNRERWLRAAQAEIEVGAAIADRLGELGYGPGCRVLEIGCGEGGITISLAASGRTAVGIEIEAARVATAEKRARESNSSARFVHGSAYELPFEDGSYDVAVMENVIEHLEHWPDAIKEASRVLRPGGLLTMTMPSRLGIRTILADPHWELFGLVLLPRPVARWVVTGWLKRAKVYDVYEMPSLRRIFRACRAAGFVDCRMEDGLYRMRGRIERASGGKGRLARRLVGTFDRYPATRWSYWLYRRFVSEVWIAEARKAAAA